MDKEAIKNLVAGLGISALMAAASVVVTPQAAYSA
ncbi:MAG: selenobiotic family radical SAM modification target peptide [Deltaproteobacteria bacterium]|nr:selenobiotic family radical SAM modification target peptide [Deltaproteobacteria bacterium]